MRAVATWHLDLASATVIVVLAGAYVWCYRRARHQTVRSVQVGCFGFGLALWALATMSAIGAYAYDLFWVRALQVLLLVYVGAVLPRAGPAGQPWCEMRWAG